MSSYILIKSVEGFEKFKEKFPETIWYIGLKFSGVTEIVMLFQYLEISFF